MDEFIKNLITFQKGFKDYNKKVKKITKLKKMPHKIKNYNLYLRLYEDNFRIPEKVIFEELYNDFLNKISIKISKIRFSKELRNIGYKVKRINKVYKVIKIKEFIKKNEEEEWMIEDKMIKKHMKHNEPVIIKANESEPVIKEVKEYMEHNDEWIIKDSPLFGIVYDIYISIFPEISKIKFSTEIQKLGYNIERKSKILSNGKRTVLRHIVK